MARKRGTPDDSDIKHLLERNKELEKTIRHLTKENGRLKKDRCRPEAQSSDFESDGQATKPVLRMDQDQCPKCGSSDTSNLQLTVKDKKVKYISCYACGERTKVSEK